MATKDRRSAILWMCETTNLRHTTRTAHHTGYQRGDWREHIKAQLEGIVDPYPTELDLYFPCDKDIDTDGEKVLLMSIFVARFANVVS